jgi:hypothetical protein
MTALMQLPTPQSEFNQLPAKKLGAAPGHGLWREIAAVVVVLVVAGISAAAPPRQTLAQEMATAAEDFLGKLSPELRAAATFDFDAELRKDWQFIPMERQGARLGDMDLVQRRSAYALLRTALSSQGYLKATTIMSLEQILREIEHERPDVEQFRDPEKYHFAVFGDPAGDQPWGWRIEGHHLSLNFSIVPGKGVSAAPAFFGANPAEVRSGPHAGQRVLGREEDLARGLLRQLSPAQQAVAVIAKDAPRDVLTGPRASLELGPIAGIGLAQLKPHHQRQLKRLVRELAQNLSQPLATVQLKEIEAAGWEQVYFAWAGSARAGEPHYFRITGPTFLVEYDNTQNDANHVHLVWHSNSNDFAGDWLRRHHATTSHAP